MKTTRNIGMKTHKILSLILIVLALTLVACGGADETTAETNTSGGETAVATLTEEYDDALTIRNQLLLGIMRLEGTPQAVTAEQTPELTTLWQAFAALSDSGTAAPEETEAIQNQIIATLTTEQVNAIAAMQLTNTMLQEFYVETGISEVKTPEPGVTPESQRMSDLPQEDREATRAASGAEVGTGGSGKSDVLLDMTFELLANK
jgi:hypothetical protein